MQLLDSQITASIFDIHRNSTHDGPGIRTTIFLKGCPLRCAWCHNPESRRFEPEVWWFHQSCIGCQRCVQACEQRAMAFQDAEIRIDRADCNGCHACAKACPSRAMRPLGERRSLADLLAEVEADRPWYDATGGGVTLSGGEPCAQPEFTMQFLAAARQRGLHTALDTCGQAPPGVFVRILDFVDQVLFDIKHADEQAHRQLTGAGFASIHANLREAVHRARLGDLKLWIRTPLIPGAAAEPAILESIGCFLRNAGVDAIERWELCAFNPSCRVKYRRLSIPWEYEFSGLQDENQIADLLAAAQAACGRSDIVCLQGLRRSLLSRTHKSGLRIM